MERARVLGIERFPNGVLYASVSLMDSNITEVRSQRILRVKFTISLNGG